MIIIYKYVRPDQIAINLKKTKFCILFLSLEYLLNHNQGDLNSFAVPGHKVS